MANSYDNVIVGAGTAGCAVANRLTEDPESSVLLLEAGTPDQRDVVDDPARQFELRGSEVDWNFETVPQPELNGRKVTVPRGKTLGGSSAINGMHHVRGNAADYDRWADLGNDGWGYDDLLPYFKRMEHFEEGDQEYRGTVGPVYVIQESTGKVTKAMIEATVESQELECNDDINGASQVGVGPSQRAIKDGERRSTAAAYIRPVLDRPNLTVRAEARVTRILFDGDRAKGVEFEKSGQRHSVGATAEVILSAGVIQTPQILMLSGVGPAAHLATHGIETTVDHPGVGRNLLDHVHVSVAYQLTGSPDSESGPAIGFTRTDPDMEAPNMQYHLAPTFPSADSESSHEGGAEFRIFGCLLRPGTPGRILLKSADPFDQPAIDPEYLHDNTTVDSLIDAIKQTRAIAHAGPLDPYRGEEISPGVDIQTEEEIEAFVRETADTAYHPVGTCKMGSGEMAVVDDRLRVHEVSGLRIVDASVMPTIPSGNTNAPTLAVAEKASDMIKEDQ